MTESETDIKHRIKDFLEHHRIYSWPILQGIGCHRGAPDRIAHINGKAVYLEIKKPGGKLSEHQLEFQAQCDRDRIPYLVVHDEQELEEYIWRDTVIE